jgi:hypothetical protein
MILRGLALLLVIANLALFIQGRTRDEGAGAVPRSGPLPAADAPRTLRLLEEVPVSEVPVAEMPGAEMPVAEVPVRRHCERIGPFDSRAGAEAATARAGGLDLAAQVRVRSVVEGTPDHQVFLPPLPSLDRARLRVRELRALGVDSFVMDDGGLEGAISIGLFTGRERAEARREEVSELGYEVRIRTLERIRQRTAIRVRGADAAAVDPLFRALEADRSGLERTVVECEESGEGGPAADRAIAPASGVT